MPRKLEGPACDFCSSEGVINPGLRSFFGDQTCAGLKGLADAIVDPEDTLCDLIKVSEEICCPPPCEEFCPGGVTYGSNNGTFIIRDDPRVFTCDQLKEIVDDSNAKNLDESWAEDTKRFTSSICNRVKANEHQNCCPPVPPNVPSCGFCTNAGGVPDRSLNEMVDDRQGGLISCGELQDLATTFGNTDNRCNLIRLAESTCCPPVCGKVPGFLTFDDKTFDFCASLGPYDSEKNDGTYYSGRPYAGVYEDLRGATVQYSVDGGASWLNATCDEIVVDMVWKYPAPNMTTLPGECLFYQFAEAFCCPPRPYPSSYQFATSGGDPGCFVPYGPEDGTTDRPLEATENPQCPVGGNSRRFNWKGDGSEKGLRGGLRYTQDISNALRRRAHVSG